MKIYAHYLLVRLCNLRIIMRSPRGMLQLILFLLALSVASGRRIHLPYDGLLLGRTADMVATSRAAITAIDPTFVNDTLAASLVGRAAVASQLAAIARSGSDASLGRIAMRTKIIDDRVLDFCTRGHLVI